LFLTAVRIQRKEELIDKKKKKQSSTLVHLHHHLFFILSQGNWLGVFSLLFGKGELTSLKICF